jgi:heme oxygenase
MLRAATEALHAEVDVRFSGPFDADKNAYSAFLTALACVVPPLERALEQGGVESLFPDWPLRRRSAALLRDLDILHVPMPAAKRVGVTRDEARLFGRLYVLEGSRLGGRLLMSASSRMPTRGYGRPRTIWGMGPTPTSGAASCSGSMSRQP